MPNPEKLLQKLKDEMGGASNRWSLGLGSLLNQNFATDSYTLIIHHARDERTDATDLCTLNIRPAGRRHNHKCLTHPSSSSSFSFSLSSLIQTNSSGDDMLSSIMDGFTSAPADGAADGGSSGGNGGGAGGYDPASIGFIGSGFTSLDFSLGGREVADVAASAAVKGGGAGRGTGADRSKGERVIVPRVFDRVRGVDVVGF